MMPSGKSSTGQPGKLQHNLNINVLALLPGARKPQREAPLKRDTLQLPHRSLSLDEEDVNDGVPPTIIPSRSTNAILSGNETNTNNPHLLDSITKTRPRGPVRRKPSTKRGREALRNSCADFSFAESLMTNDSEKNGSSGGEPEVEHVESPPKPQTLSEVSHMGNTHYRDRHQNTKENNQFNAIGAPTKRFFKSYNQIDVSNLELELSNVPKFEVRRSETFHGRERSYLKKESTSHTAERITKTNYLQPTEPPPKDRFQRSERWHEYKPHRTEQRMFTSECTVQLSRNPNEIPRITLAKSADPAIKGFLSELITDRDSFDKAVREGITETKTTTNVFRRTINTNTSNASEQSANRRRDFLNNIISQTNDDKLDKDNSLFPRRARIIEKDKDRTKLQEETVRNYREESKFDLSDNGETVSNTVTKTENVYKTKLETSRKDYDNEKESDNSLIRSKNKNISSILLSVNSEGPFDITRRSSFVKTDNFATPEFIKENLSEEEEEEDVFSEKKLPPQSDILKRSTLDDDDDEELLVKEPKR